MKTYLKHKNAVRISRGLLLFFTLSFVIMPVFVMIPREVGAQATNNNPKNNPLASYTLLEPLPCISDGTNKCAEGDTLTKVKFADYVQYIFNLIIAISAVAAVLVIVAGGFRYVTTDSFQGKNDGKKMVQEALKGLLLVLCSYLILRTIDPRLVAIPSTIVAPLNITYDRGGTAAFLKTLSKTAETDLSRYSQENHAIIQENAQLRSDLKNLDVEKNDITNKIISLSDSETGADVTKACDNAGGDVELMDLCSRLRNNEDKQREINGRITANSAVAVMNSQISNCYLIKDAESSSTGLTPKDCIKNIDAAAATYANGLKASGQPDLAQGIQDYSEYSKAMVDIHHSIQEHMGVNPYTQEIIAGAQAGVRTVTGLTGVVVGFGTGSVVGAGVGGVVGDAVGKSVVSSIVNASNEVDAKYAISEIQTTVNSVINGNKIKNPAALEQFKTESYTLIKSLGGKGDGTDKIIIRDPGPSDYSKSIYNSIPH